MRFQVAATFSLLSGGAVSAVAVLPRQQIDGHVNSSISIAEANPGPGIVSTSLRNPSLTLDLKGGNDTIGNEDTINLPAYYPKIDVLCRSHNQLHVNLPARCVPGYDRYFRYSCMTTTGQVVSHDNWCNQGYFCVDVDDQNNINGGADRVLCQPVKKEGTLNTDQDTETGEICETSGSRSNKFFGKIVKKAGTGVMSVDYKITKGGVTSTIGSGSTSGSYEISYNFEPGTGYCWSASISTRGMTADWEYGFSVDS